MWAMTEKLRTSLTEVDMARVDEKQEMRNETRTRKEGRGDKKRQSNSIQRYAIKNARYKFYQQLFAKDKKRLACVIMGEPDRAKCNIPLTEVETYYVDILEKEIVHESRIGWPLATESADNDLLLSPISVDEVREALREFRKDSAPGPDKVTVNDLWEILNLDSNSHKNF